MRRPAAYYDPMNDDAHEEANATFDHDIRMFETQVSAVVSKDATSSKTSKGAPSALTQLKLNTSDGEKTVNADMLVIASGFKGAESYVAASADEKRQNLFTAGDANIGSSLVVRAMANAREIARQVDTFLMGYTSIS